MLCEYVTRGYGDQPPSRSPRAWNGEGEVLGVVPLLCAQGREEEAQISLVAPEDVGPAEAEAVILPRTPDEMRLYEIPLYYVFFDVALDLLKRQSGIVWDPGRSRGIAPRRGREEVGEPCGRSRPNPHALAMPGATQLTVKSP